MYIKKESSPVFDLCSFSYLSVLMEKCWVRPWKALFDALYARVAYERAGKPSLPVYCFSLMTPTLKTGQILTIAGKKHSLYLSVSFRMFGVQVYRISISCHATSRRWLRMKVFF